MNSCCRERLQHADFATAQVGKFCLQNFAKYLLICLQLYIQGTHLSSVNQTHDLGIASALLNCMNNRKALPLLFQIILVHQKMVFIHVLIVYVLFRLFDMELHVLYYSIT